MRNSYANIMQSKYFTLAFNSAIFDGPIRIYFAQFHEAFALKVYFEIQQRFKEDLQLIKSASKKTHSNMMVMIYPDREQYEYGFSSDKTVGLEIWNQDIVLGIEKPMDESELEKLVDLFQIAIFKWKEINEKKQLPSQIGL